MRPFLRICGLSMLLLANLSNLSAADEGKGTVVDLDGLKARTPATWKPEKPGQFRLAQFVLPGMRGDEADTDLIIFKGLGGGVKANIERWKNQFTPPAGKNIEEVAVVKEIKIGDKPATMLEIEGTYRTAPFDPKYRGKMLPGFRMVAIYFDGPQDVYQIKLTGPDKTVTEHKKAFEEWIKSFK